MVNPKAESPTLSVKWSIIGFGGLRLAGEGRSVDCYSFSDIILFKYRELCGVLWRIRQKCREKGIAPIKY
jgi:hypothetical protein